MTRLEQTESYLYPLEVMSDIGTAPQIIRNSWDLEDIIPSILPLADASESKHILRAMSALEIDLGGNNGRIPRYLLPIIPGRDGVTHVLGGKLLRFGIYAGLSLVVGDQDDQTALSAIRLHYIFRIKNEHTPPSLRGNVSKFRL